MAGSRRVLRAAVRVGRTRFGLRAAVGGFMGMTASSVERGAAGARGAARTDGRQAAGGLDFALKRVCNGMCRMSERGVVFVLCRSGEVRRAVGWKPERHSHICSKITMRSVRKQDGILCDVCSKCDILFPGIFFTRKSHTTS